jgi:hypothetical protein
MRRAIALLPLTLAMLAGCSGEPPPPEAEATEIPEELAADPTASLTNAQQGEGTPIEQRVATLGLLNKRNNLEQEIEIKPGESKRQGNVIVRLQTCERTPEWESPPQTGAFVQVLVQERAGPGEELEWRRVFSGWLIKESPSLNVVEHPIYDVWVKDCAMSFPGETPSRRASSNSSSNASGSETAESSSAAGESN